MPLANEDTNSQLTGSTFVGNPDVVGGVYYGSGNVGSLPAFVQTLQVDVSGALYVTTSGSLPVVVPAGVNVENWPAVHGITGSVNAYTSGPQAVSGGIVIQNQPLVRGVTGSINVYTSGPQAVSGTVGAVIENWPATLNVSGGVVVQNQPATVGVSGSVNVYTSGPQAVSGTIGINNFPGVLAVSGSQLTGSTFSGYPVVAGGAFSGSQYVVKALQVDVSGALYVTTSGSLPIVFAGPQPVVVDNWPAVLAISGAVNVYTSGPQAVSGNVNLGNWPALHGVTGTVGVYTSGPQQISGGVVVQNWPLTHNVSGTVFVTQTGSFHVTVDNPAAGNQAVNIENWPALVGVSGSQLTGSTFNGDPVVAGGAFSSSIGWLVKALETDISGALYVTTSGTLPVAIVGTVTIASAPVGSLQDISFGKVLMPGAASNLKFAVRRTTYTEQIAGAQRSFKSDAAADNLSGSGARSVQITYFTSDLTARKTETVNLNGTSAVNTTNTDICFIEKMVVTSVGSGGTNAGNITLFTTTGGGGSAIGSIALATPGSANSMGIDGRTYWAHHYVKSGSTCTINTFDAGTQGNQNSEAFLSSMNPISGSTTPDVQISDSITVGLNAGTTPRSVPNTIKVLGPARITMYMIPAGNNTAFYGSFDFFEQ